jgi:alcohol dehydrogenase (cytochrome c)
MRLMMTLALFAWALPAQVTYERILNSDAEPGNWLTYSGNYNGQRYSKLDQINTTNAARLKPAWVYQTGVAHKFETSPIVVDGVMYVTDPPSNVTAIDTKTGRPIWKFRRPVADGDELRLCCGQVNRGVAILGSMLYLGTVDAHLIALDAKTGNVVWDVVTADFRKGYSITSAPLAVKDKIITGMAGGEFGVRGFIDAYDAKTGKLAWRFHTIPGPGEKGVETWLGDSWKTGAGATWITGSYDPAENLVYWGTGNPGPDWNGDKRKGDNLYSDSVVALDVDTGQLKWHFQFTPHDVHDWDAVQVPVLADAVVRGEKRKTVLWANRNAFYYVLDRATGQFLHGRAYVKQTWAKGLDDSGRPIRLPNTSPTEEGTLVYPSVGGGTNWWSPSYSPQTNLFYVTSNEQGHIYFKGDNEYKEGLFFNGGGAQRIPPDKRTEDPYGAIRALNPATGELAWEFRMQNPGRAGILSTAGGLIFTATAEGDFMALDARNGKQLWRFQTGAGIGSNPVTYLSGGKQHVAITSGSALFVFELGE